MKKLTIDKTIDPYVDWKGHNEISEMKVEIERLEKLGATHIYIGAEIEYDCPTLEISAYQEREETDQEYSDRIIAENLSERKWRAEQNLREKETYERLKKKFEQ